MRILILDPTRHWSSVQALLKADYIANDGGAYPPAGESIDLAIAGDERPWVNRQAIRHVQARGVPVLFFPDGILEWRNQFSNPLLVDPREAIPTLFMPILSDKVACIGRSQARVLESWGNGGKCEIVGAPRLDYCIGLRKSLSVKRASRRDDVVLLVQTARTSAFNAKQEKKVVQALSDVNRLVSMWNQERSRHIRLVWRLSAGLTEKLSNLTGEVTPLAAAPLSEVLARVDAVISTPSTAMLEAMACGIPTALLDYNNSPQYVQAAWSVTSPEHLPSTIEELLQPPAARLLCQEYFARDSLEFLEPASVQAARLISEMIMARQRALMAAPGRRVEFPRRILHDADPRDDGSSDIPLRNLYPGHSVFLTETARLQVEVAELRMGMRDLYRWIRFEDAARAVLRVLRACRPSVASVGHIDRFLVRFGRSSLGTWPARLRVGARRALDLRPRPGRASIVETVLRASRSAVRGWTGRRRSQVLVVDDDPLIRQWLVNSLTAEGHDVDVAGDAWTALTRIERSSYNLIVSDLRMPGMDGVALCRLLEVKRPQLARRMLFLSGCTDDPAYREFTAENHARTVTKPAEASELNRVARRILEIEAE